MALPWAQVKRKSRCQRHPAANVEAGSTIGLRRQRTGQVATELKVVSGTYTMVFSTLRKVEHGGGGRDKRSCLVKIEAARRCINFSARHRISGRC